MRSSILLLALLITFSVKAQYGSGNLEKIKSLQKRMLIVVVEEESESIIKILKTRRQTEKLEQYRKSVADYNATMREVVEKLWKCNKGIRYMKYTEAKRMYKTNQYAVLYCATVENFKSKGQSGGKMYEGLLWSYQNMNVGRDYWDKYTVMQVKLIEELSKPTAVFSQNLTNIFPEKSDIVFGVQALNLYVQESSKRSKEYDLKQVMEVSGEELASKTLLLRQDWVNQSLSETDVQSIYAHPYLIADASTFNELVMRGDTTYAYLQIVPQITSSKNKIKINYLHLIIDAAEGKVLGVSSPGFSEGSKMITKANLKDYATYTHR